MNSKTRITLHNKLGWIHKILTTTYIQPPSYFKLKNSNINKPLYFQLKNFRTGANFFELMRFDFVIDDDLKVSALEANMSPNLSSAHYPPNQLLYEQVLYSVLSLVGAGRYTRTPSLADR